MANVNKYFSGQGCLYVADRDINGNVLAFRNVGNVSALTISMESDIVEHKETCSGQRLIDKRLVTEVRARIAATLENFTSANLSLLLAGTAAAAPTTAVTGEVLQNFGLTGTAVSGAPLVDDVYWTKQPNISALAVKDSTVSPKTLTLGTNYTADLATGKITITNVTTGGPFALPLKADYTPPSANPNQIVTMFTQAVTKERSLIFSGLNTADSNTPFRVELYKVTFDPVQNLELITEEFGAFEIEGTVLYDSIRTGDATLGGFGRIIADTNL